VPQPPEAEERLEDRLLCGVLRQLSVAERSPAEGDQERAVARHKRAERLALAPPRRPD
jgi:hypothetical protein